MNNNAYSMNEIIELRTRLAELSVQHWLNYEVFTWQWWLSLFAYIIPLLIWWKIVDKKRLFEIIIFGLLVNVLCVLLDVAGMNFVLWEYPIKILPNIPLFLPIDYVNIPVSYMLIYQYFPKWKHFIIAMVIIALIFSFIGEPFTVWIKIYLPIHWKYIYSFPIYILIAVTCKWTVNWFKKRAKG